MVRIDENLDLIGDNGGFFSKLIEKLKDVSIVRVYLFFINIFWEYFWEFNFFFMKLGFVRLIKISLFVIWFFCKEWGWYFWVVEFGC